MGIGRMNERRKEGKKFGRWAMWEVWKVNELITFGPKVPWNATHVPASRLRRYLG